MIAGYESFWWSWCFSGGGVVLLVAGRGRAYLFKVDVACLADAVICLVAVLLSAVNTLKALSGLSASPEFTFDRGLLFTIACRPKVYLLDLILFIAFTYKKVVNCSCSELYKYSVNCPGKWWGDPDVSMRLDI